MKVDLVREDFVPFLSFASQRMGDGRRRLHGVRQG